MNAEIHNIDLELLAKQKQTLYKLMDEKGIDWTDEMLENMEGLLNLIDYILEQDQHKN